MISSGGSGIWKVLQSVVLWSSSLESRLVLQQEEVETVPDGTHQSSLPVELSVG